MIKDAQETWGKKKIEKSLTILDRKCSYEKIKYVTKSILARTDTTVKGHLNPITSSDERLMRNDDFGSTKNREIYSKTHGLIECIVVGKYKLVQQQTENNVNPISRHRNRFSYHKSGSAKSTSVPLTNRMWRPEDSSTVSIVSRSPSGRKHLVDFQQWSRRMAESIVSEYYMCIYISFINSMF